MLTVNADDFAHLETVVPDMEKGILGDHPTEPVSGVRKDIYASGGLFHYAEILN